MASLAKGNRGIRLTWNVQPSATHGYHIERNAEWLDSVGPGVTEYIDTSAVPGETYSYRVQARTQPCSLWSMPVSIKLPTRETAKEGHYQGPLQVTNLSAIAWQDSTRVYWARVPGAAYYEVERSEAPTIHVTRECFFEDTDFADERSGRRYTVRAVGPDSHITAPLIPEPCPSCGKLP